MKHDRTLDLSSLQASNRPAGDRLEVLDSLRGLAALAVCMFHFAGRDDLLPGSYLQAASLHGYLGVVAFFVISGFVIPWSLHRSGYQLGDFRRFVLKRLLRLEPPYLVALASVVAFTAFYAWFKQEPFPPQEHWWLQVALHLGYLTRFFGFDWLNDLYWTLAVEFQFYLLIGLTFPLLSDRRAGVRWAACAVLTALGTSALALPQKMFVITCLPVFVLGILSYQRRSRLIGWNQYLAAVAAVGSVCYFISGGAIALTAVVTAILITTTSRGWKPLNGLGTISYSLYLFHATLGTAIISLGIKHTSSPVGRFCLLLVALCAALAAAVTMYWIVERPARRWSSAVKYLRDRKPDMLDPLPVVPASAAKTSQPIGCIYDERPAAIL